MEEYGEQEVSEMAKMLRNKKYLSLFVTKLSREYDTLSEEIEEFDVKVRKKGEAGEVLPVPFKDKPKGIKPMGQ